MSCQEANRAARRWILKAIELDPASPRRMPGWRSTTGWDGRSFGDMPEPNCALALTARPQGVSSLDPDDPSGHISSAISGSMPATGARRVAEFDTALRSTPTPRRHPGRC